MTRRTTPVRELRRPLPRLRSGLAAGLSWVAVTLVGSVVIGLVGLAAARGVTRIGRSSYETEFIHPTTSAVLLLLVLPALLAGWSTGRLVVPAVLAAAVPQWFVAGEVVERYQESGWGDGLEVFAYLTPVWVGLLCALAASLGWLVGRNRREVKPRRRPG